MSDEWIKILIPGFQIYFCAFSTHADVSGLIFGTGAFVRRVNENQLLIHSGKGDITVYNFQAFLKLEDMTSYLKRYFSIVDEKVRIGK